MRYKRNAGTASAVLIAALAITNLGAQDQPPSVVGVTPSTGSGWAQTFAFQFSDPDGGASLASAQVDFNSALSAQNACYLYAGFAPEGAYIYLANDAGSWQGPILSGSAGTLQNSQCTVFASGSSTTVSGVNRTLNLAMSFKAPYAGTQQTIFSAIYDGTIGSPWTTVGWWNITAAPIQDFSITVTPVTNSVAAGGQATYTVGSSFTNLAGATITYSASSLPTGGTATFTPANVVVSGASYTATQTLTISTSASTPPGTFTPVITASGGGITHTASTSLVVSVPPPTNVSVSPASGTGLNQIFTATYQDPNGFADIPSAQLLIQTALTGLSACQVQWDRGSNAFYLLNDQGNGWIAAGSGVAANNQCAITASRSSVNGSGNTLTVSFALTFFTGFNGTKNVYILAYGGSFTTTSGWGQMGTWNVAAVSQAPVNVSVSPSAGTGTVQTFAFSSSSVNGYPYIGWMEMLFNYAVDGGGACYLHYTAASNTISIVNDNGAGWLASAVVGSPGTIENSQCRLDAGATSVTRSFDAITVRPAITFKAGLPGLQNTYMITGDSAGLNSPWQQMGTWTTTQVSSQPTSLISVTPNAGTGLSQTFRYAVSNVNGASYIMQVHAIIGSAISDSGGCYVYYYRPGNYLGLLSDTGWAGGVQSGTPGSPGTLSNSQCQLNVAASSVTLAGNNLTMNLALTFKPGWLGAKNNDLLVWDRTQIVGWQQMGTWTVGAPQPPSNVSVSPTSGSGMAQTFSFTSSSPAGAGNVQWMEMEINDYNHPDHACFMGFWPGSQTVGLANDDGSGINYPWMMTGVLGSATPLQNNQCQVDLSHSSVVLSGNNVTVNVALLFFPAFAGTRQTWLQTGDNAGLMAQWQQVGTWAVVVPVPPSVTTASLPPGSQGSAYSQALAASGGAQPYTWSIATGSLPPGLSLSTGGLISGTPTVTGTYTLQARVTGSDGIAGTSGQLSITISQLAPPSPSLRITESHTGSFTQGQNGAIYSVVVSNAAGSGPTSGTVIVIELIPTGLMPVSMSGAGWTCPTGGLSCSRSDSLTAGSSYPAISVIVNVSSNAPAQVTSQVTVSGGGSGNVAATDATTINALLRYANPLAFATSASVVGGAATTLAVTYTSDNGPSDIASGQVKIDDCYLGWDRSNHVFVYGASGGQVNGTLGQPATLSAGNCSINLADSSLSTPSGNPKALVLTLDITFPEQYFLSTDDRSPSADFVGPHEVYASGTSVAGLSTGQVDLGSLVVSQGQDFTLTLGTSESAVNLGTGATLSLSLAATGLNGFTGSIALGTQTIGGTGCIQGSWPSSIQANSQTTITLKNNSCPAGAFTNVTVHGTALGIRRVTSAVTLQAGTNGDFNIGVGASTPAILLPQSSVTYPVTVSSSNGQSGYVNLTLTGSGIPPGVNGSFSPTQVYLSGAGSSATSYLTLSGTSSTPPGTYALRIVGTLGSLQHTASFSLSTQVTTFQVTSATGSAIVHNTGQEVQVTHTIPAGNAPTLTTCGSADPNVSCRVVSSAGATVTLGITAATGTAHGTRVLSFNGGATTVHAAFVDSWGGGWPPISVQAGRIATRWLSVPGTYCIYDGEGYCDGQYEVVGGPGWISGSGGDGQVYVYVAPPLDAAGTYEYWVDMCSEDWEIGYSTGCVVGPGEVDVEAAPVSLDLSGPFLMAGADIQASMDASDVDVDDDYDVDSPIVPTSSNSIPTRVTSRRRSSGTSSLGIARVAGAHAVAINPAHITAPRPLDSSSCPVPAGTNTPGSMTFLGDTSWPNGKTTYGDQIGVSACVIGLPQYSAAATWSVAKQNGSTADASPETASGPQISFRAKSARVAFDGQKLIGNANASIPLSYAVTATAQVGQSLVQRTMTLTQDLIDTVRQEYVDFTSPVPGRVTFTSNYGAGSLYNQGPYDQIPLVNPNSFSTIENTVNTVVRQFLQSDIQVIPAVANGATGWQCTSGGLLQSQPCPAGTIIVTMGASLPVLGQISNTVPEGNDQCSITPDPTTGVCKGNIIVGSDGIPHTHANNQYHGFTATIASGYRNPEYNASPKVGSRAKSSAHTYGFALDIQSKRLSVPGKTDTDMACLIKLAGDTITGVRRSAAELRGGHQRTQRNNSSADHVHIDLATSPWVVVRDSCQQSGTGDLGVNNPVYVRGGCN